MVPLGEAMNTIPVSPESAHLETADRGSESGKQRRLERLFPSSNTDLIFLALILLFGSVTVYFHQRTTDFWGEDVFYADAARSLLQHGFYGVNGVPETTQPPGLAGLLAMLFSIFGDSYSVAVVAMAVCETLGFLVVYAFLRRRAPNVVAGAICVLLLSSSLYFLFATRQVYACFPYFFTTMLALLSAEECDKASTLRSRITWGTVLAAAVVASLLIATATMALLGALAAAPIATALTDRQLGRKRLVTFLPILILGLAVQGLWMHRKPAPLEWSLPGYPASYLHQLMVKSGNDPEMGMAKLSDIPGRVDANLRDESSMILQMALGHGVKRARALVLIPILLVMIGWCSSVVKSRGREMADWYFAGYQFIYLLWPWVMEGRFLFPIAPLYCFYIWQGGKALVTAAKLKPRIVGVAWSATGLALTIADVHLSYTAGMQSGSDRLAQLSISLWLASAGCAAWMAYTGRSIFAMGSSPSLAAGEFKQPGGAWRIRSAQLLRYASYVIVAGLVATGAVAEVHLARQNLKAPELIAHPEQTGYETLYTDVEAGIWLRSHTPANAVIMARHWPTVHHYADRKLIWFPPISDPDTLSRGIERHHVDFVVVVKHRYPYYLPDDGYCFERLLRAYPTDFRLILEQPNLRIYTVEKAVAEHRLGQPETWPPTTALRAHK